MDIGSINLMSVYVSNAMGILICAMLLIGHHWRLYGSRLEQKATYILIFVCLISCIVDPLVSTFDGRATLLASTIVYIGNLWLFTSNIVIGPVWLFTCVVHILGKVSKTRRIFVIVMEAISIIVLLINFFVPIIFSVDKATSVYSRGPLYFIFFVIEAIMILDGVIVYITAKIHGGAMKFFPVWQFVAPVFIGTVFQFSLYGISVIWPCLTISITGMLFSLQNEIVFRDSLTGLYNRSYLDHLKEDLSKMKSGNVCAVMLDLNDFKAINDNHSHSEGDFALCKVAHCLKAGVGDLGSSIRYAGDEFILILNTQDEEIVNNCLNRIRDNLEEFNSTSEKNYILSFSCGYSFLDLKRQSIDELMEEIDIKMYEDKKKYYQKKHQSNNQI